MENKQLIVHAHTKLTLPNGGAVSTESVKFPKGVATVLVRVIHRDWKKMEARWTEWPSHINKKRVRQKILKGITRCTREKTLTGYERQIFKTPGKLLGWALLGRVLRARMLAGVKPGVGS